MDSQWNELAEKELRGRSLDELTVSTPEGIDVHVDAFGRRYRQLVERAPTKLLLGELVPLRIHCPHVYPRATPINRFRPNRLIARDIEVCRVRRPMR